MDPQRNVALSYAQLGSNGFDKLVLAPQRWGLRVVSNAPRVQLQNLGERGALCLWIR